MSANIQSFINISIGWVQRNNPALQVVVRFQMMIQFIMNYPSNVKLNRFRHNLYIQQLQRMEGFIAEGSPYRHDRGHKIDRRF